MKRESLGGRNAIFEISSSNRTN